MALKSGSSGNGEEREESPWYKEAVVFHSQWNSPFSGGRKQFCDSCGIIVLHICQHNLRENCTDTATCKWARRVFPAHYFGEGKNYLLIILRGCYWIDWLIFTTKWGVFKCFLQPWHLNYSVRKKIGPLASFTALACGLQQVVCFCVPQGADPTESVSRFDCSPPPKWGSAPAPSVHQHFGPSQVMPNLSENQSWKKKKGVCSFEPTNISRVPEPA